MKRFQFRLDRLLRLKQQRERQAELRQKQAQVAWEIARSEVGVLWEQLAQAAARLEAQLGQSVSSDPWIARCEHLAGLGQAIDRAEAVARRAAEHLAQASAARAQISTEVEALLHLRDQQWQVHRQEAARTVQGQLDELGLRRWSRAQARSAINPVSGWKRRASGPKKEVDHT